MSRPALSARVLLLALAGCGSLYTEIDEPQVCQTISSVQVPGVPANTVHGVAVPVTFSLHKELGSTKGVTGEVEVIQVVLTADTGVTDFGFIQIAQLNVDVPDGGGLFVPVVEYTQPASYTPSSTLEMPGNGSNVFDEVASGNVDASLALTGNFPTTAWSADLQICVEVKLDE